MRLQPVDREQTDDAVNRVWERVLRPFGSYLIEHADAIGMELVERVRAETPEAFADRRLVEVSARSGAAGIRGFGELLESRSDPREVPLEPEPSAFMRDAARRGIPLSGLLRHSRLSHAAMLDIVIAELARRTEDRTEFEQAIRICGSSLLTFVNRRQALREDEYERERERVLRSTEAQRVETIAGILEGRAADEESASALLGYPLAGEHVGACAWIDEGPTLTYAALDDAVAELAGRLGEPSLVHRLGPSACAVWTGGSAGELRERIAAAPLDVGVQHGVPVSLGEPATGVAGLRWTHIEALHARRVATLTRRPAGSVTRYRAVAIQALASADLETAVEFAETELGPLLGGDAASQRIAATLDVYLQEAASRRRTADRLGVHENTVAQHVRRAEEVLGDSVQHGGVRLAIAFRMWELRGPGYPGA